MSMPAFMVVLATMFMVVLLVVAAITIIVPIMAWTIYRYRSVVSTLRYDDHAGALYISYWRVIVARIAVDDAWHANGNINIDPRHRC
ncbi:hypothetical protein CR159_00665 [Pollutimonas subterranea]|uniref:Uncharacterized protein n=1 Tax=Pollutimonas subterranea TaxID=2045210 RepID=A0A2N4U982_9BURK|nr:hypothetical protein CR159_00665 [Pollutimonas subterranea]